MEIKQVKCEVCGKREDVPSLMGVIGDHWFITVTIPKMRHIRNAEAAKIPVRETFDVCSADCLQKLVETKVHKK